MDSIPLLTVQAMTAKHSGCYAFNYLSFGYAASPSIFSAVMDTILSKINDDSVDGTIINYFDDISGGASSKEEMFKLLERLSAIYQKPTTRSAKSSKLHLPTTPKNSRPQPSVYPRIRQNTSY